MNPDDVKRLQAHEYHNVEAMPTETPKPLMSDFIVGAGKDDMAVFLRHTSELMFMVTPFEKEGDQYFKLTQFDEDESPKSVMYLCIGELYALQELLTKMIAQLPVDEGGA